MRSLLVALALTVSAMVTMTGCSGSPETTDETTDDALMLTNLELDLPVLSSFPARARDQANSLGDRDVEITSWSLRYIKTRDGFEGLLASGEQAGGELRYLMALDAHNKTLLLLDGVDSARDAEARTAETSGSDAEAVFAAKTFDDITVEWLRSELYRMTSAVETALDAEGDGLSTQSLTPGQVCALRLAIYAASAVVPFTKLPLVGKGASLTGQFIGSFVVDAAGNALLGNLTDAARSAAAGAASGLALESVLRQGSRLVRSIGASSVGYGASFVVGAILGADGDLQLMPGDRVEKTKDGTLIHHADGTTTAVLSNPAARLLPAACRQAFGTTR